MKKALIFTFAIIILLFSCKKSSITEHFANPDDSLHLLVPLYSFPTDNGGQYWKSVGQAANSVPIAIVWGLSDTSDQGIYKQWLPVLRQGKYAKLYAYVATTDGQRPIDSVKARVRYYATNFDIDGIFFDEVNSSESKIAYYKALVQYAKSFEVVKKVILNSSYCPAWFADSTGADIVLIFENYAKYWDEFDKAEYSNLSPERKAVIISEVRTRSRMFDLINDCVRNNIGYVYITNTDYDKLPTYWDDLVQAVKLVNQRQ